MKKYKNYNICNACGTKYDINKDECPICGFRTNEKSQVFVCYNCGKKVDNAGTLCKNCLKKEYKENDKEYKFKYTDYTEDSKLDIGLYVFGGLLLFSCLSSYYKLAEKIIISLLGFSLFKKLYEAFSNHIFYLPRKIINILRIIIPLLLLTLYGSLYADEHNESINNTNESISEKTSSIQEKTTLNTLMQDEDIVNESFNRNNKSSSDSNNNEIVVDTRKTIKIILNYQDKSKKEYSIKEGESFTVPINNDSKNIVAGTVYFHPCIKACGAGDGFETIYKNTQYEVIPSGWESILNSKTKYNDGDIISPKEDLYLKTVFENTGKIVSAEFPKVTKEGYTFNGWWTSPYCNGFQNIEEYYAGTGTENYYACWKKND